MTFNRFAGLGTLHALRTLVFRSRTAWLRRFQGLGGGVRDEKCLGLPRRRGPTVCRGRPPFGDRRSPRGCSDAVPERRVPIRPTRQCRGKSLYKTQPACIQVRETVWGHNHAKSLIVVALVMRTSNDR